MKKCSIIVIAGRPNVGKSTFLNKVIGEKISITSPKAQTTRENVRGIHTNENTQLIFVDTPGIAPAKSKLSKLVNANAWSGVYEAESILFFLDAKKGLLDEDLNLLNDFRKENFEHFYMVINKSDKVPKGKIAQMLMKLQEYDFIEEFFITSALKGKNVDVVLQKLESDSKEQPWLFSEEEITDVPVQKFAEDLTREKLFIRLQQELPYSINIETESWKDTEEKIVIHQAIIVLRESHKSMVIGNSGSLIKQVGTDARKELERILNKKVDLFLFVKVREKWIDNMVG